MVHFANVDELYYLFACYFARWFVRIFLLRKYVIILENVPFPHRDVCTFSLWQPGAPDG